MLKYTSEWLDRVGHKRKDPALVQQLLHSGQAVLVPVWRQRNLVQLQTSSAVRVRGDLTSAWLSLSAESVLLGEQDDGVYFAIDLSAYEMEQLPLTAGDEFVDLRQVGAQLDNAEASILAYARGLLYWHSQHRYCGCCGAPNVSREGGHLRLCVAPGCGKETYPRTDPVVIMLVTTPATAEQPARCLLAQHARAPDGSFSTLAGFVEPGETLESAVRREVWEETGVHLAEVRYFASQPWPFPASLMIGFRALASSLDIVVDGEEILAARWFTAAELTEAGEWGDLSRSLRIPRRDSISHYLIESWLEEQRC